MLGKKLGLLGVVIMGSSLAFTACGGDDGDDNGGSGAAGGTGGSAGTGGDSGSGGTGGGVEDGTCADASCTLPPEAPANPTAPSGSAVTFAVSKIYLGDTTRDGTPDSKAWQGYGYNLDGIISTKNGTNHCTPQMGANPSSVKTDGPGGVDNSFGANLLGIILGVAPTAGDDINQSVADGDFTIMIHNEALGTEANQGPIKAALYGGAKLEGGPAFDGSDVWPVTPELLNNGDINDPKVKFENAFVTDGTWVSGSSATVTLNIAIQGFELNLVITNAVITANVSDQSNVTGGVIAGVLDTEGLIEELRKVAGALDASLCSGTTFDSIAQQIRAASDIMANGTNGAGSTCDGISIGLGFDAKPVSLGAVAAPSEPGEDPCAG